MEPNLKLPYYQLCEEIEAALIKFTQETDLDIFGIDVEAFRIEDKIRRYNIKQIKLDMIKLRRQQQLQLKL